MKPFEIFRTGRHVPNNGEALDFADADLAGVAASYDPDNHQAPIVVGHPKLDAPAYGWIAGLHLSGDRLVATPSDVDVDFAELVQKGRFKKVSASFYKPDAPGNPAPGRYYLRHVGFLGAQPPAVKGLKAISFADDESGLVTVEFSDWTLSTVANASSRLFRRVRDFFVAERGVEAADDLLPEWEIDQLTRAGIEAEPQRASFSGSSFSERPKERTGMTDLTQAAEADELKRRYDDLAAREASFAERQALARATEDTAFVAAVVEAGRLPKLSQHAAVAVFAELGEDVISFGEGEEATTTTTRAALRELLASLPIPVVTGEIAKGPAGGIDFSDPVVNAGLITTEIKAAKEKGEDISPAKALARLQERAQS